MTETRWRELMDNQELKLTGDEMQEGWHWCPEWDDLLVGPETGEWGDDPTFCICGACSHNGGL